MSPSAGSVFKFAIKAGSIVAGALKGGGYAAVAQRAFSYFILANQGVNMYDSWRKGYSQPPSIAPRNEGIQVNSTASESALPIIYGLVKVGFKIIDIRQVANDDDTISVTGAFAIGSGGGNATAERGIHGVGAVYFDEVLAISDAVITANSGAENPTNTNVVQTQFWNGSSETWGTAYYLRYMIHNGNQTAVDYFLNNQHSYYTTAGGAWGTQTIGQGIAYATFWMHFDVLGPSENRTVAYPNGLPNITMMVAGNRVPNVSDLTSAQAYSTNPAKCIYDYMTSKTYGMGIPGSEIDTASFEAARVYCDATQRLNLASGNTVDITRFTCNGILSSGASPVANLDKLLTCCNGRIIYQNGMYHLKLRKDTAAETFQLNENNIVGDWSFRRAGIEETANSITATYVNKDQNHQTQTVTWPYPGDANSFLVEDSGFPNELIVELPFTNTEYRAVMLAAQILLEVRADITATLTAQREALKLEVGQVVKVTHSTPGWNEKEMWVEAMAVRPDGLIEIALKEYFDATYTPPTVNDKVTVVASRLPGQYSGNSNFAPSDGPL